VHCEEGLLFVEESVGVGIRGVQRGLVALLARLRVFLGYEMDGGSERSGGEGPLVETLLLHDVYQVGDGFMEDEVRMRDSIISSRRRSVREPISPAHLGTM
jgi:hypothetical protein